MHKVCHLTSVHTARDVRIFFKECSSLSSAGFHVTLLAINTEDFEENGVEVRNVEVKFKNRFQRILRTPKAVLKKALQIDADVYHLHDPELLRIALKLKRKGKKVIFDAHEDLPAQIRSKEYINKNIRKIISCIVAKYERRITSRIDAVVTATPFIRDKFLKYNKESIDINNFPLMSEVEVADDTFNDFTTENVCYIGGISEIRGLTEVVNAIGLCNNVKLLLAGTFSPSSYENKLRELKGWQYVEKLGLISRKESIALKSRCFAGIVTFHPEQNHINAQPNKIFEYMASGIPVIGSKFPLWEEIITENNAGICVDPLDPESIADAINMLNADKEKARQMGTNGKRLVMEKYNWDNESKKLFALYNRIIAEE